MGAKGGAIFVATHRRSGTHWVIDTIRRNFPRVRPRFFNLDTIAEEGGPAALDRLRARVDRERGPTLIKTHLPRDLGPLAARPEVLQRARALVEGSPVLYVYRDGRDVLVSLYHYLRQFSPRVAGVDFSDFLRQENDFQVDPRSRRQPNRIECWRSHVEGWLSRGGVPSIAYETLHTDYAGTVGRLGEDLGLGPRAKVLRKVGLPAPGIGGRIQRRLGRTFLPRWTSSAVRPRAGRVGDWKGEFSKEDLALFCSLAEDLHRRLGYEV